MTKRAWYLNCTSDDVGQCAVLVGDPGRVELVAERLDDVRWLGAERGLTTATGVRDERRVTGVRDSWTRPTASIRTC